MIECDEFRVYTFGPFCILATKLKIILQLTYGSEKHCWINIDKNKYNISNTAICDVKLEDIEIQLSADNH